MNNLVIMLGNLTRDVEVKDFNGTLVGNFSIAVPRLDKNKTVDFFNCVSFGKTAENIQKFFNKGSKILINGKLQNDSYEKDGEKKTSTKIIVNGFDFVGSKQDSSNQEQNAELETPDFSELPF